MPASLHIPGIPYMGSGIVLGRLSRASAFLALPRSPVKFRRNIRYRELPSTPPSKLPRPCVSGAPHRRRFRAAPASAVPFPSIARAKPATPPPSPPRYCVWPTPSMSKNGVSRALLNRVLEPATPPPSRIPVRVPLRSCISSIPSCPGAPRKKVGFANPLTRSFAHVFPSPSPRPSRLTFAWRNTPVAPAPPVPTRPSVLQKLVGSRSASPLRSILVRSRSDEVRAKKGVRFGDVAVREVDYWVDRKEHVFFDGGLWALGRLQGWRVTPLDTPDEDGETEKYMTMWGHDHSSLYYHTHMPPCPHAGCVWAKISRMALHYKSKGIYLFDDHEKLLALWSEVRGVARDRGHWKL
ncbi:hypothetical protein UA08_02395 [Talaromyces atroroseus]|uniref:Uncharacterized protein n=1 Tax=Talaromyces atroroseus TaxID=1441469 RepID=A0A225B4C0_TALAT|nr:hypothetical protein UA08_02395 [Talaromyces atroroseus]OKL61695.1 hypothetical protein UA08_02395 [Talaromyces atroroseus]